MLVKQLGNLKMSFFTSQVKRCTTLFSVAFHISHPNKQTNTHSIVYDIYYKTTQLWDVPFFSETINVPQNHTKHRDCSKLLSAYHSSLLTQCKVGFNFNTTWYCTCYSWASLTALWFINFTQMLPFHSPSRISVSPEFTSLKLEASFFKCH